MNEKREPIKKQIRKTIIKTILFSFIGTIFVLSLFWVVINSLDDSLYANYYENQVPDIRSLVNDLNQEIIHEPVNAQNQLEREIPLTGMDYQVVDEGGNFVYGSFDDDLIVSPDDLLHKVNTEERENRQVVSYLPIINENNQLEGSVLLRYHIESASENIFLYLFSFLILLPFLLIMLFTYYYGSKLGKKFHAPIYKLIDATESIKQHDLDVNLIRENNDEIGDLVHSFQVMKEALEESLQRQWTLERNRTDFISSVSHDLKTPLTIMKANAQMLNKKTEAKNKKYLKTILNEIERVDTLIEEFNNVKDMQEPYFAMEVTREEPHEFFNEELNMYRNFVMNENINFHIDLIDERTKKMKILMDVRRIRQVMDNIISNSLRYTHKNGHIMCIVKITDHLVTVTLKDDGPGFNFQELPWLFQKYYQTNTANNDAHRGLGLYIVKYVVEQHGGKVKAWNEQGACVSFSIPA